MPNKNWNNMVGEPKEPPKQVRTGVTAAGTDFGKSAERSCAGPHASGSVKSLCRGDASSKEMSHSTEFVKKRIEEDK